MATSPQNRIREQVKPIKSQVVSVSILVFSNSNNFMLYFTLIPFSDLSSILLGELYTKPSNFYSGFLSLSMLRVRIELTNSLDS